MRHLRKFDTQTNYNDVKSSLALPNMCLLNDTYKIASESDEDIVPIEYLQSTGTQYISTNIIPDANTGIMLTIMRLNNTDSYICGVRNDNGNTRWVLGCPNYSGYGSVIWASSYPAINIKYDVGLNYLNNKKFTIPLNNVETNLPTLPFTPTTDIRLFGSSGLNASYTKWTGKIYACKISQNNNIVMDFIPVRIGTVGYLYDKVSKKLFGNVGTGNFILGQDVDLLKFKNVITNGYGEMLNNYNFSGFTFDSSDCPSGCSGSFVCNTKKSIKYTNEYIPLRRGSTLKLKYWVKNTTSCTNYDFIAQYDSDKNEITYETWHWIPGSTTYLTQPLNNGDTVVHLANVSVYKTTKDTSKGFIIWNYKNSAGYEYPKETYSRNIYTSLWNNASTDINTTNNTITLKTAWNNGNIPAGTFISHYQAGNTYHYGNAGYKTTVDTWVEKSATFNTTTANSLSKGTAYIKIGWLINYSNVSGNIFKVSGVRLVQEKHI